MENETKDAPRYRLEMIGLPFYLPHTQRNEHFSLLLYINILYIFIYIFPLTIAVIHHRPLPSTLFKLFVSLSLSLLVASLIVAVRHSSLLRSSYLFLGCPIC